MWNPANCDRCGDCLVECLYVDWDREKAVEEISRLVDTGGSEILTACVTCCGCNEYCEKGANPWDLILKRQEETGCLPILPRAPAMFEMSRASPSSVVRGDPDKPAISLCVMEPLSAKIFQGRIFEGLTVIKGGEYFCNIGYLHIGQEGPIREGAERFVDNLAATGAGEIVCFHEDCYAMLTAKAPDYGIQVPFRLVHFFEYLLDYLRAHAQEIRKLNLRVAYQQPCASRYSRNKDSLLDEIFDRIGVFRVDRVYDRRHALCCGGPLLSRGDKERSMKIGTMNLEDARRHGAEALSFLCPMCNQTLRRVCEAYEMPRYAVSDLCRMALGETP
jgi:Cysteine-rich domain